MRRIRAGIVFFLASLGFFKGSPLQAVGLNVSLDLTGGVAGGPVTMTADPLPAQAAFGKNVMIPVVLTAVGPTQGMTLEIVYEMLDPAGNTVSAQSKSAAAAAGPIAAPAVSSVVLKKHPTKKSTFIGTAIIPRSELDPLRRGGTLNYYFRVRRGRQDSFFMKGAGSSAGQPAPNGGAFTSQFVDTFNYPVTPAGASIIVPDTALTDGKTGIVLGPDAVSAPGTLTVHYHDVDQVPTYLGLKPVVAYSFDGVTLQRTARVTLSYPADIFGNVLGDLKTYKAGDLGLYSYRNPIGWELVSRPDTDPTMHTVAGVTTHFSMFALFPAGPVGAADLRPQERIITPNGDGVNDTATFTGLAPDEEVNFFDIRGRRIRTVRGPPHVWNGTDDSGSIVESGVYVYQYASQGQRVSGVIAVAK